MILFTSNDQNKQSIEKEGKLVVAQDCWYWRRGNREMTANGYWVPFWGNENVPETESSNGGTTS